ncbi:conserved hypothetical protein [Ricinus communis]|uniref:RNase H type-1 domain-containing protein n=1 Tax=Ricinus communis TaxID=3988 RepID=B9RUV7_RICCO|nr:conserved hypothetical protein [Ricinus communis]
MPHLYGVPIEQELESFVETIEVKCWMGDPPQECIASSLVAEVTAIREAYFLAESMGIFNSIVESDSQVAINVLNGKGLPRGKLSNSKGG